MRFTALFAAVAAFAIGVCAANAQNQPTTNVAPPPNSINKGDTTKPSGSQAEPPSPTRGVRVIGSGKFCTQRVGGRSLNCRYESMAACEKSPRRRNLHCVTRPS